MTTDERILKELEGYIESLDELTEEELEACRYQIEHNQIGGNYLHTPIDRVKERAFLIPKIG